MGDREVEQAMAEVLLEVSFLPSNIHGPSSTTVGAIAIGKSGFLQSPFPGFPHSLWVSSGTSMFYDVMTLVCLFRYQAFWSVPCKQHGSDCLSARHLIMYSKGTPCAIEQLTGGLRHRFRLTYNTTDLAPFKSLF
jgi:hypothetical protein